MLNPYEAPTPEDQVAKSKYDSANDPAFHLGHLVAWFFACWFTPLLLSNEWSRSISAWVSVIWMGMLGPIWVLTPLSMLAAFVMWLAVGMQFAWRGNGLATEGLRLGFWTIAWVVWLYVGVVNIGYAFAAV